MADVTIYGVWLNGLINNTNLWNKYKSIYKGCHFRFKWSDYETSANTFVSSYITNQFQYAVLQGIPITFEIFVATTDGTATPIYLFSAPYSVPKVTTDRGGTYPYYLNAQFETRYSNMYDAVNALLASLSEAYQTKIKSWESDEGTTGDTGTYKGNIIGVSINGVAQSAPFTAYEISDSAWNTRKRTGIWPQWYADILATIDFVQPLINPGNDAANFQWGLDNLPPTWFKIGNATHNYNLPGEQYTADRVQSLWSSADNDNRTRGELEETPAESWWQAAKKSSLFGVLFSCLHTGIDMVNIALSYMNDMVGSDTSGVELTQKYWGIRNVSETNEGFCFYRGIINVTDTTLYSPGTYGALVAASDLAAYTVKYDAITNDSTLDTWQKQVAYTTLLVQGNSGSSFINPARLSSLQAEFTWAAYRTISLDQIQDSRNQDYGVYMIPNNYGKYVVQYDPDGTSKVRARRFDTLGYYGRWTRGFDTANGKNTMYHSTPLCTDNNYQTTIKVVYLNSGTNQWSLQYYNGTAQVGAGDVVVNTNTNTYLTKEFTINDFQGGGHLLNDTDFILNNENATDTEFAAVYFTRVAQNTGGNPPTANAGEDLTIIEPENQVTLTGSGTGTGVTYLWTLVTGTGANIVSPTSASTVVNGLTTGQHIFRLTVTDIDDRTASDEVVVTVIASASGGGAGTGSVNFDYTISISDNYSRIVSAVIIDARAGTVIENKIGVAVQAYIDEQLATITENTLVYTLQTANCVLVGYFTLVVDKENNTCVFGTVLLRPAFKNNIDKINAQIVNFIASNIWKRDYL